MFVGTPRTPSCSRRLSDAERRDKQGRPHSPDKNHAATERRELSTRGSAEQEALTGFFIFSVSATSDRAVKAPPPGGPRPALTALTRPGSPPVASTRVRLRHTSPQPSQTNQPASLTLTDPTDKQGSPLVRWAAIEAVGNYRAKGNEKLRADYKRIAQARRQVQGPGRGGPQAGDPGLLCAARREVRCLETAA